jgi:iron complex outermembrane receptor protein
VCQERHLETFTNATGRYRLTQVPAGAATIEVRFLNMEPQVANVTVPAGGTVSRDFELNVSSASADGKVVNLEPLSVEARAMTGQAVALTEQRNAPNIKNVIALDEFVDQAEGNIGEFIKYIPGVDLQYNPFSPSSSPFAACRRAAR